MPLFKGTSSKATPHKGIDYITDPAKAAFVDTVNMVPGENYAGRFLQTAKFFSKNEDADDRKYYHFKFSPDPRDNVSPEACQKAAMELARELFPQFECVVATHVDTGVVHSHIIFNSVSFETGLKFHVSLAEYAWMKDYANEVGKRYGMTPIEWRNAAEEKRHLIAEGKPLDPTVTEQRIILRGGTSWKEELREVIDLAKEKCDNIIEFEDFLADYGVVLPRCSERTISYLHPKRNKPVRGFKLGEGYTAEAIEQCFLQKDSVQTQGTPATQYLKQLLDTKHILKFSDSGWVDYCNTLTDREELKLFLRNAAIDSTDELSFSVVLEKDYGVTKTTLADGTATYYVGRNNKIIPIPDLGTDYANRKEIITNVVNKPTNGAYSSRGEKTERRAEPVGRSAAYGNGERRAVNAEGAEQTAYGEADGLQKPYGQAVPPYRENARKPGTAEPRNVASLIDYGTNNDKAASRSHPGALPSADSKLSNNGQSGTEAIGRKQKPFNNTDGDKGRDKGRS